MTLGRNFSRVGREIHFGVSAVKLAGVIAGTGGQTTTDVLNPPFGDDLQRLTQYQNNFFRHWLTPYWNYSPKDSVVPRNCAFFRRPDGKWDLTKYNDDYFTRLVNMITEAGEVGVAVQLLLFDRSGLDVSDSRPIKRWDDNPWNAANNVNGVLKADRAGLPGFYLPDPALRSLQEAYIKYVVGRTRSWNVFYEIMNEPMWGDTDTRVRWADWVVGVVKAATVGQNLIFYNDHTAYPRGADVNRWKQLNLPNYGNFHGVIFHGQTPLNGARRIAPTDFNPDNSAYAFRGEKIFQISTDGGPTGERDQYQPNKDWAQYVFGKGMMLQAHTINAEAARGIKDAGPSAIQYRDPPGGGGGWVDREP